MRKRARYQGILWVVETYAVGDPDWYPIPFYSFWTREQARIKLRYIRALWKANKNVKHRIIRYYRRVN